MRGYLCSLTCAATMSRMKSDGAAGAGVFLFGLLICRPKVNKERERWQTVLLARRAGEGGDGVAGRYIFSALKTDRAVVPADEQRTIFRLRQITKPQAAVCPVNGGAGFRLAERG